MKYLLLTLLFFSCYACKNNSESAPESQMMIALPSKDKAEEVGNSVGEKIAVSANEKIEVQIIKNATLKFQSDDLQASYDQILNAVKKYNGLIQSDNEGKNELEVYKDLKIRIPAKNFDAFINDTSKGIDYFDQKEISSEDVTEEFIDVLARIKTKKVLEERYLQLLSKATKVAEMIEVEQQLSTIREEIEAKEGRLNYLKNQVSQSTISINFYKNLAAENGISQSFFSKIGVAITSGFNSILNFFILLLEIWPFILLVLGAILFIKRRRKAKTTTIDKHV